MTRNTQNKIKSKKELEIALSGFTCPFYFRTNESLDAIVEGLDLKSDDSVLAIAGSGDQAFAILEYVKRVEVIDSKPNQIDFVKYRMNALKRKHYDLFLKDHGALKDRYQEKREKYFLEKGRLNRIRQNLDKLFISTNSNIFSNNFESLFSKIYLSNALDYQDFKDRYSGLNYVLYNLTPKGLIYVANSHIVVQDRGYGKSVQLGCAEVLGLNIDVELTKKANFHEPNIRGIWNPVVFRRGRK